MIIPSSPANRMLVLELNITSGSTNDGPRTRAGIENTSCSMSCQKWITTLHSWCSVPEFYSVAGLSSKTSSNHGELWESSILLWQQQDDRQVCSFRHPITVRADISGCRGANMVLGLDKLRLTGTFKYFTPLRQSIPPNQTPLGHAFLVAATCRPGS